MVQIDAAKTPPAMQEYELKPKVVKAVQWHRPGDHPDVVGEGPYAYLRNEEGGVVDHVQTGDWIVEHRPFATDVVDDEEFHETYQARQSSAAPFRDDRWTLGRAAYDAGARHFQRAGLPRLDVPNWGDLGDSDRELWCQIAEGVAARLASDGGSTHEG